MRALATTITACILVGLAAPAKSVEQTFQFEETPNRHERARQFIEIAQLDDQEQGIKPIRAQRDYASAFNSAAKSTFKGVTKGLKISGAISKRVLYATGVGAACFAQGMQQYAENNAALHSSTAYRSFEPYTYKYIPPINQQAMNIDSGLHGYSATTIGNSTFVQQLY